MSDDDKYNASCLWAEMFCDEPVETVVAAVKSFIATDTKGFPPVIGIIKDHVSKLTYGYQKTELEAWEEVRAALRNSNYHAKEEFDKLDPVIQRIVGSPSQLREWAAAEAGTPINVIASNFQRSYKAIAANQREYRALPGPIAEIVNLLADGKDAKPQTEPEEPKALPISVDAEVERVKEEIKSTIAEFKFTEMPPPLTDDEFERRRAEILKQLEVSGQ